MQDLTALKQFYASTDAPSETLFEIWERGRARGDSVTPSTYSPEYRAWIVAKLRRDLDTVGGTRLLSVGCGNAFVEAELAAAGVRVLAVDVLDEAVQMARRKGVDTVVADVTAWCPPRRDWDLIYADGLLGHLYRPGRGCQHILRRLIGWLQARRGTIVISNDVPGSGVRVCEASGVPGFYWLSTRFVVAELRRAGFIPHEVQEFVYDRPLSGKRSRGVVTATG